MASQCSHAPATPSGVIWSSSRATLTPPFGLPLPWQSVQNSVRTARGGRGIGSRLERGSGVGTRESGVGSRESGLGLGRRRRRGGLG